MCVSAGVHLAAERPLRLRRLLCVYHSLLNKRTWRPFADAGQRAAVSVVSHVNTNMFCLVQSGESIMVEVAAGPSDSAPHEKVSGHSIHG